MRLKFLQTRRNDHRKVRIFVLVADADGFVNIAVFQSLRDFRRVLTRLLFGFVVGQPAFDADGDHINRLNKQRKNNDPTRNGQTLGNIVDAERNRLTAFREH